MFFFFPFFRQIFGILYFLGYLGLKRPHILGEKQQQQQQQQQNIRIRLGKGTLNTCAKIQGLALKNGVDIWTFERLITKVTAWYCNYLVLVYIRFWALNST